MRDHRHPPDSVSNDVHVDNFDPVEAVQHYRLEAVEVEALANAAADAVTQLPAPADPDERVPFDRVYVLVSETASRATTHARHGYELKERIAYHTRSKAEDGAQSPPPDREPTRGA